VVLVREHEYGFKEESDESTPDWVTCLRHDTDCSCEICERQRVTVKKSDEQFKRLHPDVDLNDDSWLDELLATYEAAGT
jgi:hypothetical protein